MHKHCRRDFLVRSAAAGLAASQLSSLPQQTWAADQPADMTIARWKGQVEPTAAHFQKIAVELTEKAVAGLGGMKRFVKRGDVVWVKPNIGWDRTPEQAANTNPDVVATIIRLCLDAGAKKVKVGDNTCNPSIKSYATSGIADAAKAAGAEVLFLDRSRFRDTDIKGERVKQIPIYPEIVECDLVVNVPVVKHHVLAMMTMCMKNYMGVIENRRSFHQDLPTCIADLTRYMKPQICILDAMRILTAHGPTGGKLEDVKTLTTIAAGVDIVGLDAFGAELMGKNPKDIGSIVKAEQVGLGKIDYRKSKLQELALG